MQDVRQKWWEKNKKIFRLQIANNRKEKKIQLWVLKEPQRDDDCHETFDSI